MTIAGGVQFIASQQLWSGGFVSYRLDEPHNITPKSYETTFAPSIIGLALENVDGAATIRQHICRFLVGQASESWSWNYWDRSSWHAVHAPYPDDLDDTFLALACISAQQPDVVSPTVLAKMSQQLFHTETQPGGPYTTWLVSDDTSRQWHDVDDVVNGNIAAFLARQSVRLSALTTYIEQAIRRGAFDQRYYPAIFPAVYFTARWYSGRYKKRLQKLIQAYQVLGTWETPHRTAMAVSSLLRLGCSSHEVAYAIEFITQTQRRDGSWLAGAMYNDNMLQGETQTYHVGADTITTALCLEALTLYEAKRAKEHHPHQSNQRYAHSVNRVRQRVLTISQTHLQRSVEAGLERVLGRDDDKQIVLLPWYVADAFRLKPDPTLLEMLSEINIWGWASYTVFDDFLDGEGQPRMLPGAVFAARQLQQRLAEVLPKNSAFHSAVDEILNRIDAANAWEVAHCRATKTRGHLYITKLPDYGDYWQLADRSLGHALAGVGVLMAQGYAENSPYMTAWLMFFKHFIIARQLNDDAHDWEGDLSRLHINAVAVRIISTWRGDEHITISMRRDRETLRHIMWDSVINTVVDDIYAHCRLAREAAAAIPNSGELIALLQPLETAARQAMSGKNDAQEFIAAL